MFTDPAPIDAQQAMLLLAMLEVGGLRRPDAHNAPADRANGIPAGRVLAAKVYADAFNRALLSLADVEQGIAAYLDEPDAGQYPKAWPDPGKIIARTRAGRKMLELGSDVDAAFSDFQAARRRMIARAIPDGEVRADRWDRDPLRSEAMHAGWETWPRGTSEPDPSNEFPFTQARKAWCAAYTLARRGQAQDRGARRMLVGTSQPQLPGAK